MGPDVEDQPGHPHLVGQCPDGRRQGGGQVPGPAQGVPHAVEAAADAHHGTRREPPERQGIEVEPALHLGVGVEQDLKAPIEPVAVHRVGPDPPTDAVGGLDHPAADAGPGQVAGTGEPGQARPHDHHVGHPESAPGLISAIRHPPVPAQASHAGPRPSAWARQWSTRCSTMSSREGWGPRGAATR